MGEIVRDVVTHAVAVGAGFVACWLWRALRSGRAEVPNPSGAPLLPAAERLARERHLVVVRAINSGAATLRGAESRLEDRLMRIEETAGRILERMEDR